MMTFGIFLSHMQIYENEEPKDMYKNMLEMAVLADQLGIDNIWLPEHHLIHHLPAPSALISVTQIGQYTHRARIGTAVVITPFHHPLLLAGDIALADNLINGRLELGVARGAYKYEFDRLDLDFSQSKAQMEEQLEVFERIWHNPDDGISFKGNFYEFDKAYVWPRPIQKPHPPVWIGCMKADTIYDAARRGYNVFHAPFRRPMEHIQKMADAFHKGREEAGIPRGYTRIGMSRMYFVGETEAEAFDKAEDAVVNHRIGIRLHDYTQNANGKGYIYPEPNPGDDPSEEEVFHNLLMGGPEQCLEKLEEYHEAGVDHLSLFSHYGPGHEDYKKSLKLFCERVMKPYRERHAKDAPTKNEIKHWKECHALAYV